MPAHLHYRIMAWLLHALALAATATAIVRPHDQYVAVAALLASAYTHRQQAGAGADPFAESEEFFGHLTAELVKRRASRTASPQSAIASTLPRPLRSSPNSKPSNPGA